MATETTVTVTKDGPIILKGLSSLTLGDGTVKDAGEMVALCRCAHSANKPFCDGSHKKTGWSDQD